MMIFFKVFKLPYSQPRLSLNLSVGEPDSFASQRLTTFYFCDFRNLYGNRHFWISLISDRRWVPIVPVRFMGRAQSQRLQFSGTVDDQWSAAQNIQYCRFGVFIECLCICRFVRLMVCLAAGCLHACSAAMLSLPIKFQLQVVSPFITSCHDTELRKLNEIYLR